MSAALTGNADRPRSCERLARCPYVNTGRLPDVMLRRRNPAEIPLELAPTSVHGEHLSSSRIALTRLRPYTLSVIQVIDKRRQQLRKLTTCPSIVAQATNMIR